MASLIERKNSKGQTTSWQVRWREYGAQQSQSFDESTAAVTFKRILESCNGDSKAAERKILSAASRAPSFADVAGMHLKRLTNIGEHAMGDYERMLRQHILPVLGDIPIDMVSEEDVADWISGMKDKGLAPKTIKNVHGLLFSIMKTAVSKRLRADNPCEQSRLPKSTHTQDTTTYLTQSEFAGILQFVDPHFQPFFLFLVSTGLRFSEAAALMPADFADSNGVYTVRVTKAWKRTQKNQRVIGPPKTERARRTVPMTRELALAVAPQVKAAAAGDFVFKMKQGGELTVQAAWNKAWRPAVSKAQKAGLKKSPRIHDLRHTYASWMLMGEPPLSMFELSRLMGHESVQTTTKVYSHLMPETLQRGADIMGNALAGVFAAIEQPKQLQS